MPIKDLLIEGKKDIDRWGYILYSPVVVNGKLYFHDKRKEENQWKRLEIFPKNFNKETIIDIGTNTGYVLNIFKKKHNAGYCLGIDKSESMINIANEVKRLEKTTGIDFEVSEFLSDYSSIKLFDNSLLLSITNKYFEDKHLNYKKMLAKLKGITKKNIYVEPTNWREEPIKKYLKDNIEILKEFGTVEVLGKTDYQNRFIFRIDVR